MSTRRTWRSWKSLNIVTLGAVLVVEADIFADARVGGVGRNQLGLMRSGEESTKDEENRRFGDLVD